MRTNSLLDFYVVVRLLDNSYIPLNGGAGRVTDPGILGPFLAQTCQLIQVHNSTEAVEKFIALLTPQAREILYSSTTELILARDYWPIIPSRVI